MSIILYKDTKIRDKHTKIHNNKLISFVNIVIAIATLVTAYVTYSVVKEMEKQRIASTKPILKIISHKTHKIFTYDFIQEKNQSLTSKSYLYKSIWASNKSRLGLTNIGLGPALNIKLSWEIDFKKLIKQHNDINQTDPNIKMGFNGNFYNIKELLEKGINTLPEKNIDVDVLLALNNIEQNHKFSLPWYYFDTFKNYLKFNYLKNYDLSTNRVDDFLKLANTLDNFLTINLIAKYNDIHNEQITQKFRISLKFKPMSIQRTKEKFEIIMGYNIKEIEY